MVEKVSRGKARSIDKRKRILSKFGNKCAYCGCELDNETMQVDHIVPRSQGGSNSIDNLYPSCRACNYYKTAHSIDVFRSEMHHIQRRLNKSFIFRLAVKHGIVTLNKWDGKFHYEKAQQPEEVDCGRCKT